MFDNCLIAADLTETLDSAPSSIQLLTSWPTVKPSASTAKSASLSLNGLIALRAVVPPRSLLAEAADALRTDAVRSVVSRQSILCEAVEDAAADQAAVNSVASQQLPLRFQFTLPSTALPGSVYLLPDEVEDVSRDGCRAVPYFHSNSRPFSR